MLAHGFTDHEVLPLSGKTDILSWKEREELMVELSGQDRAVSL